MKKYLLGLMAVVVALSLSAFTGNYKKEGKGQKRTDLHWYVAPYNALNFQDSESLEERIEETECDGSTTECEKGFRDDQLVTPGVPNSGIRNIEKPVPEETIYETED